MNIIKKLILGSAIIGGMTVGNAVQSFAALPPLPVTYFNYTGTGLSKVVHDGTAPMISGTSTIRVTLLNGTTPIGTPQVFTYYTPEAWEALAAANPGAALPQHFEVNAYGLMYFKFNMPTAVMAVGSITSNYKLKVEESVSGDDAAYINTGNIGVRDLLKSYYESGNGFTVIANAKAESDQEQNGIVTPTIPYDGDMKYGFNGGWVNLHTGTPSEGGILGIREVAVPGSASNYYPAWQQQVTLGNSTNKGMLTISDGTTTNQVVIAGEDGTVTAKTIVADAGIDETVDAITGTAVGANMAGVYGINTGDFANAYGVAGDARNGIGVGGSTEGSGIGVLASSDYITGTALKVEGRAVFTAEAETTGNKFSATLNIPTADVNLTFPTQDGQILAATDPTTTETGKVLKVDANGEPVWGTDNDTQYTAGDGIDIDATNKISAKADGTTIIADPTDGLKVGTIKDANIAADAAIATSKLADGAKFAKLDAENTFTKRQTITVDPTTTAMSVTGAINMYDANGKTIALDPNDKSVDVNTAADTKAMIGQLVDGSNTYTAAGVVNANGAAGAIIDGTTPKLVVTNVAKEQVFSADNAGNVTAKGTLDVTGQSNLADTKVKIYKGDQNEGVITAQKGDDYVFEVGLGTTDAQATPTRGGYGMKITNTDGTNTVVTGMGMNAGTVGNGLFQGTNMAGAGYIDGLASGNDKTPSLAVMEGTTVKFQADKDGVKTTGTLDVTGPTTLSNDLDVTGGTTLKSTLNAEGDVTIGVDADNPASLELFGEATFNDLLSVTKLTSLNGGLTVSGAATTIQGGLEYPTNNKGTGKVLVDTDGNGKADWGRAGLIGLPTGELNTVLVGKGTESPAYSNTVTLGGTTNTDAKITLNGADGNVTAGPIARADVPDPDNQLMDDYSPANSTILATNNTTGGSAVYGYVQDNVDGFGVYGRADRDGAAALAAYSKNGFAVFAQGTTNNITNEFYVRAVASIEHVGADGSKGIGVRGYAVHDKSGVGVLAQQANLGNKNNAAEDVKANTETTGGALAVIGKAKFGYDPFLKSTSKYVNIDMPLMTEMTSDVNLKFPLGTDDATVSATILAAKAPATVASGATESVDKGKILTVNSSGYPTWGTVGTEGIADGSVTTAKIADNAVTSEKIIDGEIVDADIATGAAIAVTKIAKGDENKVLIGGVANNSWTSDLDLGTNGTIKAATIEATDKFVMPNLEVGGRIGTSPNDVPRVGADENGIKVTTTNTIMGMGTNTGATPNQEVMGMVSGIANPTTANVAGIVYDGTDGPTIFTSSDGGATKKFSVTPAGAVSADGVITANGGLTVATGKDLQVNGNLKVGSSATAGQVLTASGTDGTATWGTIPTASKLSKTDGTYTSSIEITNLQTDTKTHGYAYFDNLMTEWRLGNKTTLKLGSSAENNEGNHGFISIYADTDNYNATSNTLSVASMGPVYASGVYKGAGVQVMGANSAGAVDNPGETYEMAGMGAISLDGTNYVTGNGVFGSDGKAGEIIIPDTLATKLNTGRTTLGLKSVSAGPSVVVMGRTETDFPKFIADDEGSVFAKTINMEDITQTGGTAIKFGIGDNASKSGMALVNFSGTNAKVINAGLMPESTFVPNATGSIPVVGVGTGTMGVGISSITPTGIAGAAEITSAMSSTIGTATFENYTPTAGPALIVSNGTTPKFIADKDGNILANKVTMLTGTSTTDAKMIKLGFGDSGSDGLAYARVISATETKSVIAGAVPQSTFGVTGTNASTPISLSGITNVTTGSPTTVKVAGATELTQDVIDLIPHETTDATLPIYNALTGKTGPALVITNGTAPSFVATNDGTVIAGGALTSTGVTTGDLTAAGTVSLGVANATTPLIQTTNPVSVSIPGAITLGATGSTTTINGTLKIGTADVSGKVLVGGTDGTATWGNSITNNVPGEAFTVTNNYATDASGVGIKGSAKGCGVYGTGSKGVYGTSNATDGYGVYGYATQTGTIGVCGYGDEVGVKGVGGRIAVQAKYGTDAALEVIGKTRFQSTTTGNYVNIAQPTNTADVNLAFPTATNATGTDNATLVAAVAPATGTVAAPSADAGKVLTVSSTGVPTWTNPAAGSSNGGVYEITLSNSTDTQGIANAIAEGRNVLKVTAATDDGFDLPGSTALIPEGTVVYVVNGAANTIAVMLTNVVTDMPETVTISRGQCNVFIRMGYGWSWIAQPQS